MRPPERVLHAIQSMMQFDIAQAGADVAKAAAARASEEWTLADAAQRNEAAQSELRRTLLLPCTNPELLRAMHRLYQQEQRVWMQSRARLDAALHDEAKAREALAELRNRDASLDKALQSHRRQRHLEQQLTEMQRADDLWLQRSRRNAR